MKILLTRTFIKDYERLPADERSRIRFGLEKLVRNPYRGKRLQGPLKGEFSHRVGPFRIIYTIDSEGMIWAETVRSRKEVYRKRSRRQL